MYWAVTFISGMDYSDWLRGQDVTIVSVVPFNGMLVVTYQDK